METLSSAFTPGNDFETFEMVRMVSLVFMFIIHILVHDLQTGLPPRMGTGLERDVGPTTPEE
jgi:hypothetical protein